MLIYLYTYISVQSTVSQSFSQCIFEQQANLRFELLLPL